MRRRALLDTHAWLWWTVPGSNRLSDEAVAWFTDRSVELFISIVSLWEIAIKVSLNRLDVGVEGLDGLTTRLERSRVVILPVELRHTLAVGRMPSKGDPFDRMIATQSRLDGLPLITADREMASLGAVGIIWAGPTPA